MIHHIAVPGGYFLVQRLFERAVGFTVLHHFSHRRDVAHDALEPSLSSGGIVDHQSDEALVGFIEPGKNIALNVVDVEQRLGDRKVPWSCSSHSSLLSGYAQPFSGSGVP